MALNAVVDQEPKVFNLLHQDLAINLILQLLTIGALLVQLLLPINFSVLKDHEARVLAS